MNLIGSLNLVWFGSVISWALYVHLLMLNSSWCSTSYMVYWSSSFSWTWALELFKYKTLVGLCSFYRLQYVWLLAVVLYASVTYNSHFSRCLTSPLHQGAIQQILLGRSLLLGSKSSWITVSVAISNCTSLNRILCNWSKHRPNHEVSCYEYTNSLYNSYRICVHLLACIILWTLAFSSYTKSWDCFCYCSYDNGDVPGLRRILHHLEFDSLSTMAIQVPIFLPLWIRCWIVCCNYLN